MAVAGRGTVVQVSTTSTFFGTTSIIGGQNQGSVSVNGNSQDVSYFGNTGWVDKILGIRDNSFSFSGFYDTTDTGQKLIRDAFLNDTDLYVRFSPSTTAGGKPYFQQQVRVGSFEVSASVDGVVECSFDLEGTAALTMTNW